MLFEFEHVIQIPYEDFFKALLSPEYKSWVEGKLDRVERTVVEYEHTQDRFYRIVIWKTDLPLRAQTFLRVPHLMVEDRKNLSLDDGTFEWEFVPNVAASKVTAKGTGQIVDAKDHVVRQIKGEVRVRFPIFGKRVEKKAVKWIKNNTEQVSIALENFYREHKQHL